MASFDQNSKVAGHVHLFGHSMKFENVEVVGFESNYHERLFLEAWYSTLDPNAGNDHILLTTTVSREHELHVSLKLCVTLLSRTYDNEFRFHITDKDVSISRNVCYKLSRVSGKPFP